MSETFGVWELQTRLGQNELGETHLATRRADQLKAVLKKFSPALHADATFSGPLKLELELASQLKHPAIAAVLQQGEENGFGFVVLEHVEGVSLAKLSRAAQSSNAWPLSMDRAAAIMRPVLEALGAAHALSPPLLHRDLVPENVLVTREGRVVVTDFGLGRARLRAGGSSGMRRAYVSPEQARGNAIEARSEVFAAGLMLFELVCGRLPAQGGAGEVISRIATGELDAPLSVNPMLDDAAVAVLTRALSPKPEERFASAKEFFEALAPWTTASKEDPLGTWVTRLEAVKVAPPAAPPKPPEAPQVVALVVPPPAKAHPRVRRQVMGLVAFGIGLATIAVIRSPLFVTSTVIDPTTMGRPLELTSIPSGAQVYVDGILEERRTPLTLYIPKDELRTLMLKKSGFGSWSSTVANIHKLEVTIATGAIEEERYEGSRPAPKEEAQVADPDEGLTDDAEEEDADSAAPPAKREVVFDAESPPIDVVLTPAHAVNADLGPSIDIAAGTEVSLTEGATFYVSPTNQVGKRQGKNPNAVTSVYSMGSTGTFRVLNLFAFKNTAGVIDVVDLSHPAVFTKGGEYHLFSPTEAGELRRNTAQMKVGEMSIALTQKNVLRVEQDDSFLIRVLMPKVTYRVEVERADGSAGPLPVVLMSMRPDVDLRAQPRDTYENSMRFDEQPLLSGQTLVGAGSHTFSGARSVWFTILTAQGVVPPDVKLSVRPASAKKLH